MASSIKDVADLAGVSLATVSRVLNNPSVVRPEMTKRVKDAIHELDYTPNYAARSLVKKKTDTIGIIVSNLHDPFFHDLILGFETGARDTKYNILFGSVLDGDLKRKEQYLRYLNNGVVDGVILYGSYLSDKMLTKYLNNDSVRYLMIENDIPEAHVSKLLIDNENGAKNATDYLISGGFRKIACICGNPNVKVYIDRMNGYLGAMREAELTICDGYIQHASSYSGAYECMKELLSLPNRPDAVFCSDDARASFAIRAAMDSGLNVPADISVIGFDNQAILPGNYMGPSITSVEQPLFEIGKDSIRLLAELIDGKIPPEPVRRIYTTSIVEKESVLKR